MPYARATSIGACACRPVEHRRRLDRGELGLCLRDRRRDRPLRRGPRLLALRPGRVDARANPARGGPAGRARAPAPATPGARARAHARAPLGALLRDDQALVGRRRDPARLHRADLPRRLRPVRAPGAAKSRHDRARHLRARNRADRARRRRGLARVGGRGRHGAGAAVTYAVLIIWTKSVLTAVSPLTIAFWNYVVVSSVLAPVVLLGSARGLPTASEWPAVLVLGAVLTAVLGALFVRAARRRGSSRRPARLRRAGLGRAARLGHPGRADRLGRSQWAGSPCSPAARS